METREHLILFPFMAQGHLIPFLNLAKYLEQHNKKHNRNSKITLVNTPLNISKLRTSLPPDSSISLVELLFSASSHSLPENVENTDSLPLQLFGSFYHATEAELHAPFELLISNLINQGNYHICIVADFFLGWTFEIAKKLGVSHAVFLTGGAYGFAVCMSLWLNPPPALLSEPTVSSGEVTLVDYPEVHVPYSHVINTVVTPQGLDPVSVFLKRQIGFCSESSGFLVNTVEELEKEGLGLLRRKYSKPVWSIGPLVSDARPLSKETKCIEFLDSKLPNSVIYVSFGSQSTIRASHMNELAKGLEASGKPFIWVVRSPIEFEQTAGEKFKEEWLPQGFKKRVEESNQGLLVQKWAPQMEILSHTSTGAFLSHCGWNSVLESLCRGVPIIGWPLISDQMHNSKLLEEIGVCTVIASGSVVSEMKGCEAVKAAVEMVLGGDKRGVEMRKKVGEIRDVMREALRDDGEFIGSSCRNMEIFLQTMFVR